MCICVFQARPNPIHKFLAMYVTKPRLFFDHALRNRFAVPSFNVCNLEIARGVITAAEAEDAPVILQTYFGDLYHGGVYVIAALLRAFCGKTNVSGAAQPESSACGDIIFLAIPAGLLSVTCDDGPFTV